MKRRGKKGNASVFLSHIKKKRKLKTLKQLKMKHARIGTACSYHQGSSASCQGSF